MIQTFTYNVPSKQNDLTIERIKKKNQRENYIDNKQQKNCKLKRTGKLLLQDNRRKNINRVAIKTDRE